MIKGVRRKTIRTEVCLAVATVVGLVAWAMAEMAGQGTSPPTRGSLPGFLTPTRNFREAQIRGNVSRVRTDMRSLAVAIEAYYVDNNIHPAWAIGAKSVNGTRATSAPASAMLPSFALPELLPRIPGTEGPPKVRFQTLTTPVSYIGKYPLDPFTSGSRATFVYWSVFPGQPDLMGRIVGRDSVVAGVGWILVSPGPDGDYDLAGEWHVYNPAVPQPSFRLLAGTNKKGSAYTYDPTNGAISNGDIWRVKQ